MNYSSWLIEDPVSATPTPNPTGADSFEADDSCGDANSIQVDGATQAHTFHKAGDTDWVKFEMVQGERYRIEVLTQPSSPADVNLELYTTCTGAPQATWEATFTPNVRLDFDAPANGTVYLSFKDYNDKLAGADVGYIVGIRNMKATAGAGGALIIVAGRLRATDRLQENIHNVTTNVYNLFKSNGYTDEDIYYLATDSTLVGYDGAASAANLQEAIKTWAASKVSSKKPLTLYLMDHGEIGKLYLDEVNGQRVSPAELDLWLDALESAVPGVKINIIIEACQSGSFIEAEMPLSKAGRVVITSTDNENVAFASTRGAQFSDRFFTSMREGYGLFNSFWDAQYSVQRLYGTQQPWIDTNGNGIPNELADGAEVASHNPGTDRGPADSWAPYIVRAEFPDVIRDGTGKVLSEVRDNKKVKRVWMAIYPPSYQAPTNSNELAPEDVTTVDLVSEGKDDLYSVNYDGFNEKGLYRIAIFAEDEDGLKARLQLLEFDTGLLLNLPDIRK